MGGFGSGRQNGRKLNTQEMRQIDVRQLQRARMLERSRWPQTIPHTGATLLTERESVILGFYIDGKKVECPVKLERIRCNYGGERVWFTCPACFKRVAILYGGQMFACRHCHKLAYVTQQLSRSDRLLRKAQKIRLRLGGSANMLKEFPEKPKGMHRRTHSLLQRKAADAYLGAMTAFVQAHKSAFTG